MHKTTYQGEGWTPEAKKFAQQSVKESLALLPKTIHAPIVFHNKPAMDSRQTFVGCYWSETQVVETALMCNLQYQKDVLLHELGHHYWYTHLSEDERQQFTSWVDKTSKPLPLKQIRRLATAYNCKNLKDFETALCRNYYPLWLRLWHVMCKARGWEHIRRRPKCSIDELMAELEDHQEKKVFLYPFSCVCLDAGSYHVAVEIYAEAFEWHQQDKPLPQEVKKAFAAASGHSSRYRNKRKIARGVVGETRQREVEAMA